MPTTDVKQDLYILGQSEEKTIAQLAEEIRLDLALQPNENLSGGTIFGVIKDEKGGNIDKALIKIMTNDHQPLAHTFSGADGSYTFSPFQPGNNYHIYAIAQGYKLEEQIQFNLLAKQQVEKNFTLKVDPSASLSIIAGDVFNSTTGAPVKGAVVKLSTVKDTVETLYAITYTNEFGQYVFRELSQGNYIVRITALGYIPGATTILIDQPGQIANTITKLVVDTQAARGTVSGIITDNKNNVIVGADVILYDVKPDNSLNPIAFTKTNDEGVYLFINVSQGKYRVKSNKIEEVVVP